MSTFSVIIPTINEAEIIKDTVMSLKRLKHDVEIIVVDGKSTDRTVELVRACGIKTIETQPCRGRQCNLGAREAKGSILIFLYADTRLPPDAFRLLENSFADEDTKIGTFSLRLDYEHWLLRFYAWCARFDSRVTRFGDSCIVIRKKFFMELGGFPEWSLFDDTRLLEKARRTTKVHLFEQPVITSARKFLKNGIIHQYCCDAFLMLQYLCGIRVSTLERKYYGRDFFARVA